MSVDQHVVQPLDGLERLLTGFQLNKAKAHGLAVFVLDNLGVLERADLLEDLINAALLRLKVQVLDVDHLAQFSSLFLLLLQLLDLLDDVGLIDHPQGRVLEIDEVVLELVALKVLHHVVRKLRVLELGYRDGAVGRNQKPLDHPVKL